MAGLKGLPARLSRILFILRPQLPGKQQVTAQKHCSRIRRLPGERESFSVLSSGISAQGVGVCVWQSVCECVSVIPRAKPYRGCFAESLKAATIQVRVGERLQAEYFCHPSPVAKSVPGTPTDPQVSPASEV